MTKAESGKTAAVQKGAKQALDYQSDWKDDNRVILRETSPPNSLSTNECNLTVLMQEVPPQVAHWIGVSMNGDESYNPEGNSDMRLSLNQERIQALQDHAQEYIDKAKEELGIAANEPLQLTSYNVLAIKLSEAKTPTDIAKIFATTPADKLSDGLLFLAMETTSNEDKTVDGLLPESDAEDGDSPVLKTREI